MRRYALLTVLVLAVVLVGSQEKPTAIYKWNDMFTSSWSTEKAYQFVISSPPKGQRALVELIRSYLINSPPPGFWNGEYGTVFYRESTVTPTDESLRPESNWWDQSWDVPYIKYKPIDDQEIIAARYVKSEKILRIFFLGEYRRTCKTAKHNIIDVQPDGTHSQTCD
ncbi:hypothetical protein GL272_21025 [Aeromonas veronii]|uniref:hypothetical protein n=1 Tax=Aeromonas veronii TaxID=654 RepID=UPI001C5B7AD4|nr:hypothetical protein [Aeromonas veronii]MBW3779357.1 hypothetical protein [Aeromonas veronii]